MKIIISPAKKMNLNTDLAEITGMPVFMEDTATLIEEIRKLTYDEAKNLWKCNDKLASLNYERFCTMDPHRFAAPALLSYEGLQFRHIAPAVLEAGQWEYLQEHLRILSGLYGIVRPFDGVTPYRLEMQARLITGRSRNLYEFWDRKIYDELAHNTGVIVNLASKEYSKCVEPYITGQIRYITCVFGEYSKGRVIEKGTLAKMARGEMVRFMAEQKVTAPEQMKAFSALNFRYDDSLSTPDRFVFIADRK